MRARYNYHPRSEVSEVYVFTGVCHSVTDRGGGVRGVGGRCGPGIRSQHLPSPPGTSSQHLPSPPGPGDNTSPPPGTRSQHLPLGQGDNTPPPTWDQVTTPPPPGTMHRWAVHILLECILASFIFHY